MSLSWCSSKAPGKHIPAQAVGINQGTHSIVYAKRHPENSNILKDLFLSKHVKTK